LWDADAKQLVDYRFFSTFERASKEFEETLRLLNRNAEMEDLGKPVVREEAKAEKIDTEQGLVDKIKSIKSTREQRPYQVQLGEMAVPGVTKDRAEWVGDARQRFLEGKGTFDDWMWEFFKAKGDKGYREGRGKDAPPWKKTAREHRYDQNEPYVNDFLNHIGHGRTATVQTSEGPVLIKENQLGLRPRLEPVVLRPDGPSCSSQRGPRCEQVGGSNRRSTARVVGVFGRQTAQRARADRPSQGG
jgi:hypothetical protein